ncbi:MAG: hypothetical protein ING20_11625 [Burkholderiales bacterium]|nr:hypothetical protein [Burkholderiales bacterium]
MDEEAYSGPERRTRQPLSDEQIEHIAQRAAELAVQKMTTDVYASVGKTVLQKVFWIVGVVATAMVLGNASIKELLK